MVGYHEEHRQHELHLRKDKKYPFDSTPEYDPDDPDANEDGYVELPNVDLVMEMTDFMGAGQAFSPPDNCLRTDQRMFRRLPIQRENYL